MGLHPNFSAQLFPFLPILQKEAEDVLIKRKYISSRLLSAR